MMIINKPPVTDQPQNPPFLFRKRVEKIDWRRLAAVDVNRVASQIDIDTLQEILTSVAFCDISSEIDTRYVDTNFIKLFQLAQLLVEYLLYSQDYLTNSMNALKEENEELKKNVTQLQEQLVEKSNRLTVVRRECHRRRLLLLAQQQLMDSGPQSYHRCAYCPKAFLNASFLAAHVHRRHPETEVFKQVDPAVENVKVQSNQISVPQQPNLMDVLQVQNNNTGTSLEREVRELLEQLKSTTQQSPKHALMFMKPSEELEKRTTDEDTTKPDWQTVLIEEHRRDMEILRNTFEKELRALQAQHAATQEELVQLKVRRAASNLGELMDDVPQGKTDAMPLSIQVQEMSSKKDQTGANHQVDNTHGALLSEQSPVKHTNPNTSVDILQFTTASKLAVDSVDHSVQTKPGRVKRPESVISSCSSLNLAEHSIPVPARNHSSDPPTRWRRSAFGQKDEIYEDDDDDNDNAESDITCPTEVHHRCCHRHQRCSRIHESRSRGRHNIDRLQRYDNRVVGGEHKIKSRMKKRVKKRIRSTAIQVGHGRRLVMEHEQAASLDGDEPVFLRIKRPYSRSASSTSASKSRSPEKRHMSDRRGGVGFSREIVIVRTEDEDGSGDRRFNDTGSENSATRSVHLMPTPTILPPKGYSSGRASALVQRERVISVGASVRSNVPESSATLGRQSIPVYDEPTLSASKASLRTEPRSSSEHASRASRISQGLDHTPTASESRTASAKQHLSRSPLRNVDQVAETEDTEDESDDQKVSRVMDRVLTDSTASSPAPSVHSSTNVLRYSRLLDQLRADPETLRGLRHEVEQLLVEQLSERGIQAEQTRLTTTQLNERLIVLRREREHLARKHVNFLEIRETLARHVDRMANAMLHGKSVQNTSAPDIRPVTTQSQRASLIARSGLPPPAMHSPSSIRKAGTLPTMTERRTDLASPLGNSMPTLNRNDQHSGANRAHNTQLNASRPHFQHSSPHLQFDDHFEEPESSGSALRNQSPVRQQRSDRTVSGHGEPGTITHSPSPRKARRSPQRSRKTASPLKETSNLNSVLKSPTIQLSHDQRVMTFNPRGTTSPVVAASSTDEWDSEPDDDLEEGEEAKAVADSQRQHQSPTVVTRPPTSNTPQLMSKRSSADVPDVLSSGVDLDEADRFLNELGQNQRNTNAPYADIGLESAPIHMVLNRAHSVRTDDEDICSVSSINGGAADDNSLSLLPGTPTKHGPRLGSDVFRSLDPGVAMAQAQAAALGPRPSTRFGSSARRSLTAASAAPGSVGSPDTSQTLGTSLWGTNSKAASISTNINAVLKSDNVDDDFDTDD